MQSAFSLKIVGLVGSSKHSYVVNVKWFQTIKDIKDIIHRLTSIQPSRLIIFHSSTSAPLRNGISLEHLGISLHGKNNVILFTCTDYIADQSIKYCIASVSDLDEADVACSSLLTEVSKGLESQSVPKRTEVMDCTGGVYFMLNSRGGISAVFKPQDEEQGMANNTKGYADTVLRDHFRAGDGYLREFAAYLVDSGVGGRGSRGGGCGFSGVPPTVVVHCEHRIFNYSNGKALLGKSAISREVMYPKLGSLQKYVRHTDLFEDLGSGLLSDFEVQKIALLDIRILNCDRNSSNILVNRRMRQDSSSMSSRCEGSAAAGQLECDVEQCMSFDEPSQTNSDVASHSVFELFPIDHGYCFPTKVLIMEYDWCWYHYPQLDREVVPEIKAYLQSIDIDTLVEELRSRVSLPVECWYLLKVVHRLLVRAVLDCNWTLRQVASVIAREDEDVPSALEKLIAQSESNASRLIDARYRQRSARGATAPRLGPMRRLSALASVVGLPRAALHRQLSLSPSFEGSPQHSSSSSPNSQMSLTLRGSSSTSSLASVPASTLTPTARPPLVGPPLAASPLAVESSLATITPTHIDSIMMPQYASLQDLSQVPSFEFTSLPETSVDDGSYFVGDEALAAEEADLQTVSPAGSTPVAVALHGPLTDALGNHSLAGQPLRRLRTFGPSPALVGAENAEMISSAGWQPLGSAIQVHSSSSSSTSSSSRDETDDWDQHSLHAYSSAAESVSQQLSQLSQLSQVSQVSQNAVISEAPLAHPRTRGIKRIYSFAGFANGFGTSEDSFDFKSDSEHAISSPSGTATNAGLTFLQLTRGGAGLDGSNSEVANLLVEFNLLKEQFAYDGLSYIIAHIARVSSLL